MRNSWNSILALGLAITTAGCASQKLPNLQEVAARAFAAASKELQNAATAHKVSIDAEQMIYSSDPESTIVYAPIVGIERYGDSDFAAGAPIHLLVVNSRERLTVPNGSYVVKAQHEPGARSGIALFTDRAGTVVAREPLFIRTWEQAAVLFPDIYSDASGGGAQEIPNITSLHKFVEVGRDSNTGKPVKREAVDCSGWDPPRTLYYYTPGVLEVFGYNRTAPSPTAPADPKALLSGR